MTALDLSVTFGDSFVQGLVMDVDLERKVAKVRKVGQEEAEEEEDLPFSYLILATGSSGPFPGRTEVARKEELQEETNRVAEEV